MGANDQRGICETNTRTCVRWPIDDALGMRRSSLGSLASAPPAQPMCSADLFLLRPMPQPTYPPPQIFALSDVMPAMPPPGTLLHR